VLASPEGEKIMQIDSTLPIMMEGPSSPGVAVKRSAPERKPEPALHPSKQLEKALGELSQAMEHSDISLKFSKDEETGRIVIQMIDQKSGDMVQQIPDAAMLHVAAVLGKLQGKIFDEIA
jgi:flagellar protein FlaG